MAAVTTHSDFRVQKRKSVTTSTFPPSICHEVMGSDLPCSSDDKTLPTMQETRVRSLGQEDPLEKGMANYSSILTWSLEGYSSWGHRVGHDWVTNILLLLMGPDAMILVFFFFFSPNLNRFSFNMTMCTWTTENGENPQINVLTNYSCYKRWDFGILRKHSSKWTAPHSI